MNNRNFSEWLLGFRDSIADYGYYIDFYSDGYLGLMFQNV